MRFLFCCISIILLLGFPAKVLAHHKGITYLTISPIQQAQKENSSASISASLYISWTQLLPIATKYSNDGLCLFEPIQSNQESFSLFVQRVLKQCQIPLMHSINNAILIQKENGLKCLLQDSKIPNQDRGEILVGKGVQIDLLYTCINPIENISIKNTLFMNDFAGQLNYAIIEPVPPNTKETTLEINTPKLIYNSFTHTIPKKNPGQTKISALSLLSVSRLQKYITPYLEGSMIISMLIAYSLGLLHTLEAGHSKTILTGVLMNGNTTRYKAFGYVLFFTFTHIADILILGTILTVLQASFDVYSFLPRLELLSGIILLCIGLIMFYKTIKHTTKYIHPHLRNHAHAHKIPTQIFDWKYIAGTAIASGLAPCLMGWSLFFIVLSTKSVWAIFPVILAFGLGIATVLITMILISQLLIRHLPKKFGIVSIYAPLISSLIILFSAIMIILKSR